MTATTTLPSEEQMWAGLSGERWLANAARLEISLHPIAEALFEKAGLAPGQHVIDVGCGAGAMTLEIADRVAPSGSVTALDICPALITEANRRAAAAPLKVPVRFVLGDAGQAALPPQQADLLLSRFGIMFFTHPYSAFAHLRSFLRPTGKLAFACWASPQQNPWMSEVRAVVSAHIEMPIVPPRTPGPFAFDDPDYVREILLKAGFQQIDISPWQKPMFVGGPGSSPESAGDFMLSTVSIIQRIAEAPPQVQQQIREGVIARLRPFMTPQGVVMTSAIWLVTASA